MGNESLTITDNRTGKSYELPLKHGNIRAMDLRQIKTTEKDFGVMSYDPAFLNTAACESRITFIDGDLGILRYRGYPIEQLAAKCSYLETAYLLLYGELPDEKKLSDFTARVARHTFIHENMKKFMEGFRYDAHPMSMLVSSIAALSSFYPDAREVHNPEVRELMAIRLIAKIPTIAAYAFRHTNGLPFVYPDNELSYTANFMNMLWKMAEPKFLANPVLAHALDILFILHADHEQNCSTSTMRVVGSSQADPFLSMAAAASALSGPLHGGANEEVLRMIDEIGSIEHIPAFIESVKKGERKLMGFGHRVYKNYDPRAQVIKETADSVFAVTGRNPKVDIAREIEKIALSDEYFVKRRLYPNVDFYSGIIYEAMGFRPEMFTVLFAIPRTSGWLAHWEEQSKDADTKISRPRQVYLGSGERNVK
ncbi:citrate synthase [Bryobacter aggregatus]|uniref:citrate synthase n=1 Tax=Bryobacter aggregatus TaxID=360054 RepID=UPI0004E1182A|nr:citrate synthase [Bryobacter aggregatus]